MKSNTRSCRKSRHFCLVRLFGCLAVAGLVAELRAQEIVNSGFEEPSLEILGKSIAIGRDTRSPEGWTFGQGTGICLGGVEHAEGLAAVEGAQVAFLKGAPTRETQGGNLAPIGVIGISLTGLDHGVEYDLEWVQAGSVSDEELGAVTTIITDPDDTSVRIAKMNRVETKGKWQKCTMRFQATAPVMRLFVCHSIPGLGNGTATGEEVTVLDDFRLRQVD